MDCSPPPPISAPGFVHLPPSVEDMLWRICTNKCVAPPEPRARKALADLGEAGSLQILRQIAAQKEVRSLTGFIIHMAREAVISRNHLMSSDQSEESVCSPIYTSTFTSRTGETSPYSSSFEMPMPQWTSPHVVALGELEFRKAFLILSYVGKNRLEDKISIDMIKSLKNLPMVPFELEIWSAIGRRCINESDRQKNLDWDSGKTHLYHCLVDPDGSFTFKGPYLQPNKSYKTHLERVLGDENVLLVKFSDGVEGNRLAHGLNSCSAVYHKIAREGILVGLRRYHFFVFKDGGKAEKKKDPGSSSVKCYFVRMKSGSAIDENKPYILFGKSIHEARSLFMHIHEVPTLAKYMKRFSLILSKTIKLEVDLASVYIRVIDDIPCTDEDGNIVYNEDGEPMIHTDGTGFISEDLALKCPRNVFKGNSLIPKDIQRILDATALEERSLLMAQCNFLAGEPPLLIQVRLFNNGCTVKGTLLVNKKLPPSTILVRPSMVKVEVDPKIANTLSANSLEVVGTSNQPKKSCFSKHLISLLHYGGVPREYFLELLTTALDDAQTARFNKKAALRVGLRYGEMDDYIVPRMIFSGIPIDEPYLQDRLLVLLREEKKVLKEGRLPVHECYYLMGTADPTGALKPDEVCIILDNGQVSGDVLVYKNPGLHFGDIHVLTATYVKELEGIVGNSKYGIFFPTKGPRSLADEIANSDFDGDMYWVSRNPQLLQFFKPSKPWVQTSLDKKKCHQAKPSEYSATELENNLFQLFLETRFNPSFTMGAAADSWLAFMDRFMTLGDDCSQEKQLLHEKMLKLVDIYYVALDASKSGQKVEVPVELKAEKYPHFLEKKCSSYHSTSILGMIYDKVDSFQADIPLQEIWQLPCFDKVVPRTLELWRKRYEEYRSEMSQVLDLHSMSKSSKDTAADKVKQKYKRMLYGAAELEDSTKGIDEIFDGALAIYQLCYNHAKSKNVVRRCSFAWNVAGRALCLLHNIKQGGGSSIPCSVNVLRELLG